MRYNEPSTISGNLRHFPRFGEAAYPPHVGLQNIQLAPIRQIEKLPMRVLPFTCRDADWRMLVQIAIAVQIIDVQRSLDKEQIVGFQPLKNTKSSLCIRPAI